MKNKETVSEAEAVAFNALQVTRAELKNVEERLNKAEAALLIACLQNPNNKCVQHAQNRYNSIINADTVTTKTPVEWVKT